MVSKAARGVQVKRTFLTAFVAAAITVDCGGTRVDSAVTTELARPPATMRATAATAPISAAAMSASTTEAVALLVDAIGTSKLVLLGEMHGTREIPAITGELAAHYATRSDPVLLGLEATSNDQARVDRYLESADSQSDRTRLLAGKHWREPHHDGRDSRAMLDLIERMRQLRATGARVSVVLFDTPGDGERNQRMAVALRAAIQRNPAAMTLVLTGNVHAMTGNPPPMIHEGKPYALPTPVGRHLADLSPLSIDIQASRGEFVRCQAARCGPQAVMNHLPERAAPTLERADEADSPWDMTLTLPRFTVSEPVIFDATADRATPDND